MSDGTFELHNEIIELARRELMQGLEEFPERRRSYLYNQFSVPGDGDRWVDRAARAYQSMTSIGGWTSSVGDLLLAELDVRDNADLYAAVACVDIAEISGGLGAWWSPSPRPSGRRC